MKILKILTAIILIFTNKTFSQIEITFSDAEQWVGGKYINAMIPYEEDSIPDINVSIGENIIWDFSNISDTIHGVSTFETSIRNLSSSEQVEFPNATNIEVTKGINSIDDSSGWVYIHNDDKLIYQGYTNFVSYSHFNNDTTFYYPLQFGEMKVGYDVEMFEGIAKVLSRHFNAYGKFIMPGGEEIDVLEFREMMIYEENNTDHVIYSYKFYSKEYGRVGEIFLQELTDTTVFNAGNTYNMKTTAFLSSDSLIFLRLMKSPNSIEISYHTLNQNNINWVKNLKIKYTLINNGNVMIDIYTMQGKKIRSLVNGFKKAGSHEVVLDVRNDSGGNVAGGVYFLKLSANGSAVSRKVTIVR